jgi:hypothetical protein
MDWWERDVEIGRLSGALEALQRDMEEVKRDMKLLLSFRAWLIGASAAISAVVSGLVTFFWGVKP